MRIDVFSVFPELIRDYCDKTVLGRAQRGELLDVRAHDLRMCTEDVHHTVDDKPFGGGAGMVLMPEPVFRAVEKVDPVRPLFLMSPGGRRLDQAYATELSQLDGFSLLCGRYEGVDDRIRSELADGEISIGDFVLAGGELAALTIIETVARLLPGVLGNASSALDESFTSGLHLEYPQYTRPANFRDMLVPEVLRSGDHARVERWRRAQSIVRTMEFRSDLLQTGDVTSQDWKLLAEFGLLETAQTLGYNCPTV
ncbi:MAG: tRNA (guanosine(37)-N1)-methyltransferase TrmD [Acidimicrobiales bacterium]